VARNIKSTIRQFSLSSGTEESYNERMPSPLFLVPRSAGLEDYTLFLMLRPGSFVQIDPRVRNCFDS
jgi:hypothetical protein